MRRPSDADHDAKKSFGSDMPRIVVAGPSSSLTIPGIVVSQIVQALAQELPVTRIGINLGTDFDSGLHRAPSLAVAHDNVNGNEVTTFEAPVISRLRAQALRQWITPDVDHAIAFVWPGIDNTWIRQFLSIAKFCGSSTTVVCVSVPKSSRAQMVALADSMSNADLVLVGSDADVVALRANFGHIGPAVEMHRALSLHGRSLRSKKQQITAFLPRDNTDILEILLAAYDAIPEAWIPRYHLQVVMRHEGDKAPEMVAGSYHADYVELVGGNISSLDLKRVISSSSALIIADPTFDSRAFSIAVDCGIAVVVLATAKLPDVGRGYVGALLADMNRPVSVHVALSHALRLAELQFPRPDAWNDLVGRMTGSSDCVTLSDEGVPKSVVQAG